MLLPVPFLSNFFTLALVSLVLFGCGEENRAERHNKLFAQYLGQNIAELKVLTLDAEPQTMAETAELYDNKPIVLNVWATWCPPCLKELPSLDALAKEGDYTVITLATDKTAGAVQAYLQKQPWGAHFKVLHDPAGRVTYGAIGARALPVTYILDEKLTIQGIEAGERDWNSRDIRAKITQYLK